MEYHQTQPELQRLEGERQALISRLGESMYHMWRTNQFSREAFETLCRDIRRCEEAMDASPSRPRPRRRTGPITDTPPPPGQCVPAATATPPGPGSVPSAGSPWPERPGDPPKGR